MTLEEIKEYARTQHGLIAAQQRLGTTTSLDHVIEKAHAAGEAAGRENLLNEMDDRFDHVPGVTDITEKLRAEAARNTP